MITIDIPKRDKIIAGYGKVAPIVIQGIAEANHKSALEGAQMLRRATPVSGKRHEHIITTIRANDVSKHVSRITYGSSARPAGPLELGHKTKKGKQVRALKTFRNMKRIIRKKYLGRIRYNVNKGVKLAFN